MQTDKPADHYGRMHKLVNVYLWNILDEKNVKQFVRSLFCAHTWAVHMHASLSDLCCLHFPSAVCSWLWYLLYVLSRRLFILLLMVEWCLHIWNDVINSAQVWVCVCFDFYQIIFITAVCWHCSLNLCSSKES